MSDKAMLVLGEASESDDEDYNNQENEKNDRKNITSSKNGLAESDQTESEDSNCHTHSSKSRKSRNVKENFAPRLDNYKMSEDTLLHRKLKEKNMQFYSNLSKNSKQMYVNAMNEMNEMNLHLVKAQVLLQDTVSNWKYIEQNLLHIKTKMTDILSEEYIPKINI